MEVEEPNAVFPKRHRVSDQCFLDGSFGVLKGQPGGHARLVVAEDGLSCSSGGLSWVGTRSTERFRINPAMPVEDCLFCEMAVMKTGDRGVARLGVCTSRANLTNIGGDAYSWGYGGTGKKSHNAVFTTWGEPYQLGHTIGLLLNLKTGDLIYFRNGKHLGRAFNLGHCQEEIFIAVCLKNSEIAMNFGHGVQNKLRWPSPFLFAPNFKSNKAELRESGGGAKRDRNRSLAIAAMELEGIGTAGTYDIEARREALFRTIFALAEVLEQIMSLLSVVDVAYFRAASRFLRERLAALEGRGKGKWPNDRLQPALLLDTFNFMPNYNMRTDNDRIELLRLSLTLAVWPPPDTPERMAAMMSSTSIRFHTQSKGKAIYYASEKYVRPMDPTQIDWRFEVPPPNPTPHDPQTTAIVNTARDAGTRVTIRVTFDINFPLRNCDLEVFVVYYSPLGFEYRSESKIIRLARKVYESIMCLHGNGLVSMADGCAKRVSELTVGDEVMSTNQTRTRIAGVVIGNSNCTAVPMIAIEGNESPDPLWLTPRHPVRLAGRWRWPEDLRNDCPEKDSPPSDRNSTPRVRLECVPGLLYNFVTEHPFSSLIVNGREVGSLGQFCAGLDDVNPTPAPADCNFAMKGADENSKLSACESFLCRDHEENAVVQSFFGSDRVVTELQNRPDWPNVRFAELNAKTI